MKLAAAKFISFVSLFSLASVTYALSEECSKSTVPASYLDTIGLVCLQKIITIDPSDSNTYKSTLQWLGSSNPELSHQFLLTGLEIDNMPAEPNSPSFAFTTGILSIPKIDIPKQFGTERYSVNLSLIPDSSETIFQLNQVSIYINPDYVAGRDWKPFGMLAPEERRATDLLGRSLPYMQLADLVYDFDNTTVGTWKLIETKSRSSGMDAGLYENQNTNPKEIALIFRGTETCDFPCSFEETEDFLRDITADTAIATGTVSDQFKHAFNFALDVINRYSGAKIIVAGHSLGGGLAQAVGATLGLEAFAFNSSPVPDDFFDTYTITLPAEKIAELIHVIADIHDPISNADESGDLYINAHHVTPLLQFNFETKEILPTKPVKLRNLRFDRHSITELYESSSSLMNTYLAGW
ncbi:MAG: lipase [Pseudomonadota bacterium]